MDKRNYLDVINLGVSEELQSKVALLRSFDPTAANGAEVPDPYYGGDDGFENVYQMLNRAVEGLLLNISNKLGA
jgi:protein-tyrosine phosphatase